MGCANSKAGGAAVAKGDKHNREHAHGKARRLSVATGAMDMEDNATEMEGGTPSGGTGSDGPGWLRYAAVSNAGCSAPGIKKKNQDAGLVVPCFNGQSHCMFFCVFDGHGQTGHFCSAFIKKEFPTIALEKFTAHGVQSLAPGTLKDNEDAVRKAFKETFITIDSKLCASNIDCMLSGSTAVSVFICGKQCAVANAGDSRAVMGSVGGKFTELSIDQKPEDPVEKKRIDGMGGVVRQLYDEEYNEYVGPHRVWSKEFNCEAPGIAMARSIGDQLAADCGVICDPEVLFFDLSPGPDGNDKFAAVCSDGVWEFIESKEGMDMVRKVRAEGGGPKRAAEDLARESLARWNAEEDVVDDITAIVLYLDNKE